MKLKIDTFYIVIKSLRKDIIDGDTFIIRENTNDPSLGKYIVWLSAREPKDMYTGVQRHDCKYFNNDSEVDTFLHDIVVEYNLALVNKFISRKLQEITDLRHNHEIQDVDVSTDTLQKEKRISFLQGALKYTAWADYVPDGNEICDDMQRELELLTGKTNTHESSHT